MAKPNEVNSSSGVSNLNILITGGAGFIGVNTAIRFAPDNRVTIVDNLSRPGSEQNLLHLKENYDIEFVQLDISSPETIKRLLARNSEIDVIIHLAGQVAVTESVRNPMEDFRANALGTLNLLEYARRLKKSPLFMFASTNKVYGSLEHLNLDEKTTRYQLKGFKGIDESAPLDFHSPYGCSKGCADQYVFDYCRIYDLPTVVFRQSCIYGENQYGMEDQGWVAWFLIASHFKKKITVYGNGKQVRDLLHISDLIDAYALAIQKRNTVKGRVFNIGGGYENALSILEFFEFCSKELDLGFSFSFAESRHGDQKVFISDNSSLITDLMWHPKRDIRRGIAELNEWIIANKNRISTVVKDRPCTELYDLKKFRRGDRRAVTV